jgi:hypothetical protein
VGTLFLPSTIDLPHVESARGNHTKNQCAEQRHDERKGEHTSG